MSKLAGLILPILFCATTALGQATLTVTHGEVPQPTYIDLGATGDSVGDQRLWHFAGETLDGQSVTMDWTMTTTSSFDQATQMESRLTNGVFLVGDGSSDHILIEGVGLYPVAGSTVVVASTLERAITGGTGKFAGARGTVMSTHLADGTWEHVFSLE
ncbi:dirigent protein [Flavimaricola sp.]|jgi:hypothetical protein|nr:hypothetical protein [Flavimaricola sp.]MDA9020117.1 dirigent protein [Flavimaricola sp.]